MVCSATETVLAVPTTVTGTPRAVQVLIGMLSYPTPWRETTLSAGAASSTDTGSTASRIVMASTSAA